MRATRRSVDALGCVVAGRGRFPFTDLVDGIHPLGRVDATMADLPAGRVLHTAIVP